MSPRPKRTPDTTIVETASRVIAKRGAAQTRLADVAAASGFAAATLVQRFGSRDGLLRAVGKAHVNRIADAFANDASAHLDRITRALSNLHAEGHLSFVLVHPAIGPSYSLELRKHIGLALAAAVEAGELPHCDIAAHARRVQLAYYGLAVCALIEQIAVTESLHSLVREVLADYV